MIQERTCQEMDTGQWTAGHFIVDNGHTVYMYGTIGQGGGEGSG